MNLRTSCLFHKRALLVFHYSSCEVFRISAIRLTKSTIEINPKENLTALALFHVRFANIGDDDDDVAGIRYTSPPAPRTRHHSLRTRAELNLVFILYSRRPKFDDESMTFCRPLLLHSFPQPSLTSYNPFIFVDCNIIFTHHVQFLAPFQWHTLSISLRRIISSSTIQKPPQSGHAQRTSLPLTT